MKKYLLFLLILPFFSCHHKQEEIRPQIDYVIQDKYLKQLPAPFATLSSSEKSESWGHEQQIGIAFAHELDLYQAMTAFKRADILVPKENSERHLEIQYDILLCYYLGQKYDDVLYTFNHSDLRYVNEEFPAFHDLLVILYDTYYRLGLEEQKNDILEVIKKHYPKMAEKLTLSSALLNADIPTLHDFAANPADDYLNPLLSDYNVKKKSPNTAKTLNAILPGAGYLYIGQAPSALTAFLLNALFIAAAWHCFDHHQVAAGVILTSFESGWYIGGIYGAGQEAYFYNERLYEKIFTPVMNEKKLFPIFMLRYSF